jgi:cytochrome P460
MNMRTTHLIAGAVCFLIAAVLTQSGARAQQGAPGAGAPRFTAGNELIRPTDFREWIFVTSGLGMTYNEVVAGTPARVPNFTNVYVNPGSYRNFMKTGQWLEQTIFILEIRASQSEGSINKGGNYQSGVVAIEASVKDSARYPGKWGYFNFGRGAEMKDKVEALPATASCYSCHATNAAVDNTFVQFYPTLLDVAREKNTLRAQ